MATRKQAGRAQGMTGYEKISASLEHSVLRMIRERSTNVSEFLNDAAKDKLYFDHIREGIRKLEREGVRTDPEGLERMRKGLMPRARGPRRRR